MKISDWLIFAETIILALTGIIVYWYTKETQKIRKETSNQNLIMTEQLRLMKESIYEQDLKEQSLAEPLFQTINGIRYPTKAEIKIINKGATIKNIKILKKDNFVMKFSSLTVIGSDEEVTARIAELPVPNPDKIFFQLEYDDKFGNRKTKDYSFALQGSLQISEE
jgi:hypothetical protein